MLLFKQIKAGNGASLIDKDAKGHRASRNVCTFLLCVRSFRVLHLLIFLAHPLSFSAGFMCEPYLWPFSLDHYPLGTLNLSVLYFYFIELIKFSIVILGMFFCHV